MTLSDPTLARTRADQRGRAVVCCFWGRREKGGAFVDVAIAHRIDADGSNPAPFSPLRSQSTLARAPLWRSVWPCPAMNCCNASGLIPAAAGRANGVRPLFAVSCRHAAHDADHFEPRISRIARITAMRPIRVICAIRGPMHSDRLGKAVETRRPPSSQRRRVVVRERQPRAKSVFCVLCALGGCRCAR